MALNANERFAVSFPSLASKRFCCWCIQRRKLLITSCLPSPLWYLVLSPWLGGVDIATNCLFAWGCIHTRMFRGWRCINRNSVRCQGAGNLSTSTVSKVFGWKHWRGLLQVPLGLLHFDLSLSLWMWHHRRKYLGLFLSGVSLSWLRTSSLSQIISAYFALNIPALSNHCRIIGTGK